MTRSSSKKVLVAALATVAVILFLFVVVYVFGTPQSSPQVGASSLAPSGSPASKALAGSEGSKGQNADAGGEVDPNAEAPPADPSSPLAIQIPGCVCHSDDPKLVEEHSKYRMNQCAGCHIEGVNMGR